MVVAAIRLMTSRLSSGLPRQLVATKLQRRCYDKLAGPSARASANGASRPHTQEPFLPQRNDGSQPFGAARATRRKGSAASAAWSASAPPARFRSLPSNSRPRPAGLERLGRSHRRDPRPTRPCSTGSCRRPQRPDPPRPRDSGLRIDRLPARRTEEAARDTDETTIAPLVRRHEGGRSYVAELITVMRSACPIADGPLLHQPRLLINIALIVKRVGVDHRGVEQPRDERGDGHVRGLIPQRDEVRRGLA